MTDTGSEPMLWISAAVTPDGTEFGTVAVIAATREEAIAKAGAKLELALKGENYRPAAKYAQALLDNLDGMSEVEGDVFIEWAPTERRR